MGYFSVYIHYSGTTLRSDLFWEYNMNDFDYQNMIRLMVQRVVESGGKNDFFAMHNLYGQDQVIDTIKILPYLREKNMNFASKLFNIPLEDLLCYRNLPSRQQCWNYRTN